LTLIDELIAGVEMMKQEMLQTVLCVTWSFLTALVISGYEPESVPGEISNETGNCRSELSNTQQLQSYGVRL